MSRRLTITIIIGGIVVLAFIVFRYDYFRHEWYHSWTAPRQHNKAKAFAASLRLVITNDARFSGVWWSVRVRPHRDPAIHFRGAVQSDAAIRDLQTTVNATRPPFDIEWEVAVTNAAE
jgi:hypothetical protein